MKTISAVIVRPRIVIRGTDARVECSHIAPDPYGREWRCGCCSYGLFHGRVAEVCKICRATVVQVRKGAG